MTDILTGTPPGLTYDHDLVRHAWFVCWIVSTGILGLVIGWMGLTLIVGEHLGRQSPSWKEMVPRLCLGLAAAAASLWWCSLVIDLADSISGYVAAELNGRVGQQDGYPRPRHRHVYDPHHLRLPVDPQRDDLAGRDGGGGP